MCPCTIPRVMTVALLSVLLPLGGAPAGAQVPPAPAVVRRAPGSVPVWSWPAMRPHGIIDGRRAPKPAPTPARVSPPCPCLRPTATPTSVAALVPLVPTATPTPAPVLVPSLPTETPPQATVIVLPPIVVTAMPTPLGCRFC